MKQENSEIEKKVLTDGLEPGRNHVYSACCSAHTDHQPVQQTRQLVLRAYCPNIYTVLCPVMSHLPRDFKPFFIRMYPGNTTQSYRYQVQHGGPPLTRFPLTCFPLKGVSTISVSTGTVSNKVIFLSLTREWGSLCS